MSVLVLRLVAFMQFDIGTRSAVARKHLLYVSMFSHASIYNAFHLPGRPDEKNGVGCGSGKSYVTYDGREGVKLVSVPSKPLFPWEIKVDFSMIYTQKSDNSLVFPSVFQDL
jgi:hypothetical protein